MSRDIRVVFGSEDAGERSVDLVQLAQELFEDVATVLGKFVEALLAVVFLAPFALEEALAFEAAKKGVEGAFIDLDAEAGEILAQGIAVMFAPELGQDRDDEKAATELEPEMIEKVRI